MDGLVSANPLTVSSLRPQGSSTLLPLPHRAIAGLGWDQGCKELHNNHHHHTFTHSAGAHSQGQNWFWGEGEQDSPVLTLMRRELTL